MRELQRNLRYRANCAVATRIDQSKVEHAQVDGRLVTRSRAETQGCASDPDSRRVLSAESELAG